METNRKVRIGDKLTPSAKILIAFEAISACLAAIFLLIAEIVYLVSPGMGLKTFSALFFPLVICIAVALTVAFLIAAVVCLMLVVGAIIFECVVYGKFYLAPFTFVG